MMLANGAKETTTTTGTGAVTLSAVTGFPRFSQVLSAGRFVDYAIQDGNNWEWGVGKVAAGNTLERTLVTAKFDGGTYSKNPATRLSLSGGATVFCAINDATDGASPGLGGAVPNGLHVQTQTYGSSVSVSSSNKFIVVPWVWPRGVDRFATGVAISVGTTGTATKCAIGVVDYGATWAESKVVATTGLIDLTTTGIKTAAFTGGAMSMPKARYGLVYISDGACTHNKADGWIPDPVSSPSGVAWDRYFTGASTITGWSSVTQADWDSTYGTYGDSSTRISIRMLQS